MKSSVRHKAVLVGNNIYNNNIFNRADRSNRDNCNEPYINLRDQLRDHNIEIVTSDLLNEEPLFEIHLDVQKSVTRAPCYLLLMENPNIWTSNLCIPKNYRAIFTWNDQLVDGCRIKKINYPNKIEAPIIDGDKSRPIFSCMIAGNKGARIKNKNDLYGKRIEIIKWFERHAPSKFQLYGPNWAMPFAKSGLIGKLKTKLLDSKLMWIRRNTLFTYKGMVDKKYDVLRRAKFCFSLENTSGYHGYITEKIFDCFLAGCVPIYMGAPNVTDYVPANCFIDLRNFRNMDELYSYLNTMSEEQYTFFQSNISQFMRSSNAQQFSSSTFVKTIISNIVTDMGAL